MSGHKPFSELTKDFSAERNARIEAATNKLREEIILQELLQRDIGNFCTLPAKLPQGQTIGEANSSTGGHTAH